MTKYFVMRECEDIPTGISLCCNSALAHKKSFSIFKFPERFSEISCRDLTTFTNFFFVDNSNHVKDLVIHILWTLVMSFSDANAMIPTVILTASLPRHSS